MFVCPVPNISQVKMKRRRWASHLGRHTFWHDGRWATLLLGRFTLCDTTAAELLHHSVDLLCGTTDAEPLNPVSLMHAPGVAHIFQRQWRTMLRKYEGLIQSKQTPDKHRSICTLYEDKYHRWGQRTHESPCELAHQSEAKRKQSLYSEANVCRHKCNLEKPPLLIAQITQHKLGVAFSHLERN